ncbi:MAG TPA: hypothetical protein VFR06_07195 [Gallionellaceae bacterium]|nr:hypothetical protein [Gallionellaceae bacterium]
MVDLQNLSYAGVQVAHNFGAVAVVGGPALLLLAGASQSALRRKVAWLVSGGWLLQILSGIGFGVISYIGYGSLPDIHGIAIAALYIKVFCALAGLLTALALLRNAGAWSEPRCRHVWQVLLALGVTALTAAAFLRWFS